MKLTVTGRHVVVSDAARRQIGAQVARLDRLLADTGLSAQCIVSRERHEFVCELVVHARGDRVLRAIARHARLASAVVLARERVSQQAQRLVDRWKTRKRAARPDAEAPIDANPPAGATDGEVDVPRIIRSRGDAVKPMTIDDAVLALADGRPFVVFRHAPSETIAVLYRRPDGHFGLIDPEA